MKPLNAEMSENVWSMIFLAYLLSFIGPFASNAILSIIGVLEKTFSVSVDLIALSITLYLIPFSVVQLFSGAITDKIGYFKGLMLGLVIYTLAGIYVALSPTIVDFLIARFLQGIGAAFLSPVAMAMLGDFSSPRIRGTIMSGYAVSATAGVSLGPFLAGYLALVDWRIFFYLVSIVSASVAIVVLTRRLLLSRVHTSKSASRTIDNLKIGFKDVRLILFGFIGFLIFFARIAFYTYLSKTLEGPPYSLSPIIVGTYVSIAGLAGLVSSPVAGFLIDRVGKRKTALAGGFFIFLTFLLYFITDWYALLYFLVAMMGFSITLIFITMSTIVVDINPSLRSTYSSIYNALRFLGYSLGPTLALPVYLIFGLYGVLLLCLFISLFILTILFASFSVSVNKIL